MAHHQVAAGLQKKAGTGEGFVRIQQVAKHRIEENGIKGALQGAKGPYANCDGGFSGACALMGGAWLPEASEVADTHQQRALQSCGGEQRKLDALLLLAPRGTHAQSMDGGGKM